MARLKHPLAALSAVCLGAVLLVLLTGAPANAAPLPQETEAYCLSCHGQSDLSLKLPSGETLSLFVDPAELKNSIHSPLGIECEACHTEIKTYPHPAISFQTRREISRSYYEACQKCHSANYEKAQDSMHATLVTQGKDEAPVCTDCHGAHNVQKPNQPRARVSMTCSQCHAEVYGEYKDSVHGSALIQQDNPDVPVCTDCHGVHNIQDPRTAQFRVGTPEMCAGCHADPQRMGKYKLSTDVYSLYKTSFHGVDVSVYKANWPTIWHESAVCTDCHGVHNIRTTDDSQSKVNPANLLSTCQQCHTSAGPNWTSAWTGHNRIDPARTPFLFAVEQFYSTFTTFILWVSIIYVALQIIRAVVGRVKRSLK